MTPIKTGRPVISRLILAFFEDTSWYKVNYDFSEQFFWGRNNGCEFLGIKCVDFQEYCNVPKNVNCTPDFLGKSQCTISSFSDLCNYNEYFREFNCHNKIDFK